MRRRALGASGLMVSEIGLGTWQHVTRDGQQAADRLVRAALGHGISLIDTADSYGDAQDALGHALRGVPRDDYVLSSKVYFAADGGDLSAAHIRASTDASLRQLDTGHIDLLTAHRFDPGVPLRETVAAFGALVTAGKIRHWGVSEWTAAQIAEACEAADALGVPRPVANQPQYSVLWRVPEGLVVPACQRFGLGVVAFWPLAQGVLSGKYRPGAPPPEGTRAASESGRQLMAHLLHDPLLARVELFARLARRLGLSTAQLALAWTLGRPGVNAVLVGASRPSQLADNAGAAGVQLDEDTVALIDKIFAGCVYSDVTATG